MSDIASDTTIPGTPELSRRTFLGLAGAAGLALSGICGAVAPGQLVLAAGNDTVIMAHSGDPKSWCPDVIPDDYSYYPVQNMFHRLTKLDVTRNVIPDAAESWDVSDDGLTITFHLRQDLFWSDGEPLTSADVVYTFEGIKANEACYLHTNMTNVDSFEAPDDYTAVFHLAKPDMSLISTIGWYAGFILPKHVYDVEGVDWVDNAAAIVTNIPVTSGPYRLVEYKQGQSVTLEANESYYHVPQIKRLVYSIITDDATSVQALLNAEIDVLLNVPTANVATVEADPSLRVVKRDDPTPTRILFNFERTERHLDDPAVRRAICMCIDRDAISKKAFGGIMPPETNFYPSHWEQYTNSEDIAPAYDPQGARKLLEEAGYVADGNGMYITGLTIDAFSGSGNDECAKLIAAEMTSAGLECSVVMSEMNAWSDKVGQQHDFDIELQSGFLGPDPYALKLRWGTGVGPNYGSYSNPEFDELCEQANATADEATRVELYKQAQAILAKDLPFVPICAAAYNDAFAAGLVNTPVDGKGKWAGVEWTFAEWSE